MPEGDTIYRTARSLRPVLQGQRVVSSTVRADHPSDHDIRQTIRSVEARGKHLLIHLADGGAIHSHMGMTGSWHIYGREDKWRKPASQAAMVLHTASHQVVCFTPKTLEVLSSDSLRRHPWLGRLGPDILADTLDLPEILRRLQRSDSTPIGVALLDQTIACGIGNVYKSEVLFEHQTSPFMTVKELTGTNLGDLMKTARRWMRRNLDGYPRITRFGRDGARKWVYGRSGAPCFRCGCTIQMRRQGDLGRSTYYCPDCQSVTES